MTPKIVKSYLDEGVFVDKITSYGINNDLDLVVKLIDGQEITLWYHKNVYQAQEAFEKFLKNPKAKFFSFVGFGVEENNNG